MVYMLMPCDTEPPNLGRS